jgi:hypothetical protein
MLELCTDRETAPTAVALAAARQRELLDKGHAALVQAAVFDYAAANRVLHERLWRQKVLT